MKTLFQLAALIAVSLQFNIALAERMDNYQINRAGDTPGTVKAKFPAWFKNSFYDLNDDLAEARQAGKRGIIVFFSQENCSHCRAFLEATFSDPDLKKRVIANYDVVGMDIFNDVEVTDIDGTVSPIKDFTKKHRAYLTPTIMFYGVETTRLAKILGFYPPERFHRVLDYIDGKHYVNTKLSHYLRSETGNSTQSGQGIVKDALFNRTADLTGISVAKGPTMVLFEKPGCKACRRFHDRVLRDSQVRKLVSKFNAVQVDTAVERRRLIIPGGRKLATEQWVNELQIGYDYSVVFYDEQGKEVYRLDSEIGKDRFHNSLVYVLEKGYLHEKQTQRWRRNRLLSNQGNTL